METTKSGWLQVVECARNRVLSHVAQDVVCFWFWVVGGQCAQVLRFLGFLRANKPFHPPEEKGGPTHRRFFATAGRGWAWGGMEYVEKAWTWTPNWWALMDMGGFNPEAANQVPFAGFVHGIAPRPKSKPKPAATPAEGPMQPHPPNPRDALAKALGAISPALYRQGKYVDCVLALI